ncbi:glycerate kinase [Flavobacteriaceae bacterium]|nr:glycerate kinase [Flavobacteriaceae bacterium]
MRILIVSDSFKESLSASEAAEAIASGILTVDPSVEIQKIPFSDGGEGALDVLQKQGKGELVLCKTENALGRPVEASYFKFHKNKTAWIELSQASGLALIPPSERDVLNASTYGTGRLIKDAIDKGCREIILGLGGSATNDGGAGLFQALGGKLLDSKGKELQRGGASLSRLHTIIPPNKLPDIKWTVACDVDNPLLGVKGASTIYGPQKGANIDDVQLLEKGLTQFSRSIESHYKKDISKLKGGGAAGGTAAGISGFFDAKLAGGFSLLAKMIDLESSVKQADLLITTEGKLDQQSINGKLTIGVARLGKKHNLPVIGLAGAIEGPFEPLYDEGFTGIFSIQSGPLSLEESQAKAAPLIHEATSRIYRFFTSSKNHNSSHISS